jgi:hypothetical protein
MRRRGPFTVINSNRRGKVFYDYWNTRPRATLEACFNFSAEIHLAFRLFSIRLWSKTLAVVVETTLILITTAGARKSPISLVRSGRPAKAEPDNQLQHLQNMAFLHDGDNASDIIMIHNR